MIISYDTRPQATADEKVRSLMASVQMALNDITANGLRDGATIDASRVKVIKIQGTSLVGTIDGNYVFVKNLDASAIKTGNIDAARLAANVVDAVNASIEKIDAGVIDVESLKGDYLDAVYLSADAADLAYAKIDGANITTATIRDAWVDNLLVQTGLLANTGTVYELDAVQVNASKIKAGTLDVERLIVTVNNEKYLVHVNAQGQPSYEKLHGNIIQDNTITADKIVAHSITAAQITAQNLVGTGGWINLAAGTFQYVNASTGEGISWDGTNLTITASSISIGASGVATQADIPTDVSDLNNDAGYVTSADIPTDVSELNNDAGYVTSADVPSSTSDLTNDSGFITSADVPTDVSELTNDAGYVTSADVPTSTSDLTNDSGFITSADVPTNVSELTNDAGYQTSSDVSTAIIGKADIEDIPTKTSDLTNDSDFATNAAVDAQVGDLSQTVDDSIDDLTSAAGEMSAQIEAVNSTLVDQAGDISQLQTDTQTNAGAIAANAGSISTLQMGQVNINNSIVSIRADTQALADRTETIEKAVVIDPSEPSVTVVSGQGAVKITDAKVIIRSASTSVAWGDSESFNAQKGVFTEIRPRMMNISGQAQQAGLVFLVRNNGHVSLKRAE